MTGRPSITFENVTKRYGKVVAVDNVSLTIEEGEFFALLGPSGCGKTTLLRMVAGLEIPDEGRILIDGKDVTAVLWASSSWTDTATASPTSSPAASDNGWRWPAP